jgi:hypothetical protein
MSSRSFALVLVGLSVAVAGWAGDAWEEQCREQLRLAGVALASQDYQLAHQLYTGKLSGGAEESLGITLDKDRQYALVGVCDEDCKDLDLVLLTLDDEEVDSDVEQDEFPMVEVEVAGVSSFKLKVLMADCQNGPCFYCIGVFTK